MIVTADGDSSGKSEDDETPQSVLLEVDDNVTSMGLRLLVPPKTFCDVIDTSTSCASEAQREPVESEVYFWSEYSAIIIDIKLNQIKFENKYRAFF